MGFGKSAIWFLKTRLNPIFESPIFLNPGVF
jgi:hypothetical protein